MKSPPRQSTDYLELEYQILRLTPGFEKQFERAKSSIEKLKKLPHERMLSAMAAHTEKYRNIPDISNTRYHEEAQKNLEDYQEAQWRIPKRQLMIMFGLAKKYNASIEMFSYKFGMDPDAFPFIKVNNIQWDKEFIPEVDIYRGIALMSGDKNWLNKLPPCNKKYLTMKIEFNTDLPDDLLKNEFIKIVKKQCADIGKPQRREIPANMIRQVKALNMRIRKKTYYEIGIELAPPRMKSKEQKTQWARDAVRAGYGLIAGDKYNPDGIKERQKMAAAKSFPCDSCEKMGKRGCSEFDYENCERLNEIFLPAISPNIKPSRYAQGMLLDDDKSKGANDFDEKYHQKEKEYSPVFLFIKDSIHGGNTDKQIENDVQSKFSNRSPEYSGNNLILTISEIRKEIRDEKKAKRKESQRNT